MNHLIACLPIIKQSVISHKVPLLTLLVLLCCPHSILGWVWLIVCYSAAEFVLKMLPPKKQEKIQEYISSRFHKEPWITELKDGIVEARPFVLASLYFWFVPVAIACIGWQWLRQNFLKRDKCLEISHEKRLLLCQNRSNAEAERRNNFYHSPAFAPTLITIFASGLPALISYCIYYGQKVDAYFRYASFNPGFGTFMMTYLYVASLVCCLTFLLARAWFTFPAALCSSEHTVEVTEKGIRKNPIDGWFASVLSFNSPGRGLSVLDWKDVGRLSLETNSFYPLPDQVFARTTTIYRVFNIVAGFMDGIVSRVGRNESMTFYSASNDSEQLMKLSLKDLSSADCKNFFMSVCKWAPHISIDDALQLRLVGSTVMKDEIDARHWFAKLAASADGQPITAAESPSRSILKSFAFPNRILEYEIELRLGQLKHPNLIQVEDQYVLGQTGYLRYEWVEGKTLRQFVREEGPLDTTKIAEIAAQICSVLDYLHKQTPAVICRQLTPDNIALRADGRIVLFDINEVPPENCSYTAPEQMLGEAGPQNDIYALGGLLHFLSTGQDQRPFDRSDNEAAVLVSLERIVEQATDVNPKNRYESLKWLSLDLKQLEESSLNR